MAVTSTPKLDAQKLRADFAVFDELVNGKPVAYLDSASSTQKPRQVLDAMREFYEHSYANVHRGVYTLAERATAGYEGAREKVRAYINAPSHREVIFTRSATEALNLIAYSWGLENLGPGDVVVITELEHHANFVPWQFIAKKTGATFAHIPIDDLGELQLDTLDEIASRGNVKVVANNLVSNTLGTINPVEKLADWAHSLGAIMVVDAAQAAPHRHIDVQALGCDFLAFSSHKLCGPSGVGALWGKRELLDEMQPFNLGGEMIRSVALDRTSWNELPYKFEAGTPAIAEAYGFGQALDYVSAVGLDAIEAHEHELVVQAMDALAEIPGLRVFGPPGRSPHRHRQLRARRRAPARRRADPQLGRRRRPRRPPLHAAADDAPRRRRDDARELLPLLRARGRRPPDRRPAQVQRDVRSLSAERERSSA